eukprot:CAMPEP_0172632854 /NCGR_PEP_ID=MMETSP1068-20121228/186498_1 /TAXON_ID=35684 /ORGANISM="Pseudopedinella elastica, Strain CCMP716" /LENGTH=97 /DNA_ID=CAMNT_0013444391 /DNA_START=106 /DNA_END=399 /DNA_ORIENTATION=+
MSEAADIAARMLKRVTKDLEKKAPAETKGGVSKHKRGKKRKGVRQSEFLAEAAWMEERESTRKRRVAKSIKMLTSKAMRDGNDAVAKILQQRKRGRT